jgi:thiamine transporter
MTGTRTRVLVEMALSIGLAWVLARFVVFRMPNGGTISLGMLPLFVFALRRGLRPGLLAGALYGVLDLTVDPYIFNWAQVLLDYPLAYMMIGAAGALSPLWRRAVAAGTMKRAVWTVAVPAIVLGSVLRFAMHWWSGVVFFGSFAPAGQPVWLYSVIYNVTYVGPSLLLCAAAAVAVLPTLQKAVPAR